LKSHAVSVVAFGTKAVSLDQRDLYFDRHQFAG
jgi:hypothetical protein